IMLRLVKNFNLNLQATWDPYTYRLNSAGRPVKVNVPRWKAGKGWVKLASTGTSFSYTFNNNTFKRKKKDEKDEDSRYGGDGPDGEFPDGDYPADGQEGFAQEVARRRGKKSNSETDNSDADGYEKWECPWSLTFNYSVSYGYGDFDYEKMDYKGRFSQNLSFSGNIRPTKNWNFSFSASYDFNLHKIAYMNCSISRDLHCFTMSASFVPLGPYKSYNFHIAVKSSMLKDLKYDKRSSQRNGINWY
ncbi:MAG: LPS-assembly protein LptD, partial [Muribaculaceae bacterium]|nr:LPS-assembly protein LptD [Muribaculaceae bacterium]